MSLIQTRYRNGVTNFGVICGFATNTDAGDLHLLQNGCQEMGWTLKRSEGARGADYDFEPVVAVCQMEPPEDEWSRPQMTAMYVTRMSRSLLPTKLVWRARDWPHNSPYYPYHEPHHSYNFPQALLETLDDTADYPDWLLKIADEDEELGVLLEKYTRVRYMQNAWVLTGRVVSGSVTEPAEVSYHEDVNPYIPLELWQPGNDRPFHLRLPKPNPEFHKFCRRPQELQATILCHGRVMVLEHVDGRVLRALPYFRVEKMLVPSQIDVEDSE